MCGIYGWTLPPQSGVTAEQRLLLGRALAVFNDHRGGDSWGAAVLNGSFIIKRGIGRAGKMDEADWAALHFGEADVVMGHARKATTGAITIPNCHPFEIGNIIGAHNGMVYEHEKMNKDLGRTFDVDSMHIFAHLDSGMPTKNIRGYGACEYMTKGDPQGVYLFRFNSGELACAGLKHPTDGKSSRGVIWSSSREHLEYALELAGIPDWFSYSVLDQEILHEARDGKLYVSKTKVEFGSGYSGSYSSSGFTTGYGNYSARDRGDHGGKVYHWDENGQKIVPGLKGAEATVEEDAADEATSMQDAIWGNAGFQGETSWESENYVVTRSEHYTSIVRKETLPAVVVVTKGNEPAADDAKAASDAIVAELSPS